MLGKSRFLSVLLAVALTTVGIGASAVADSGSEQAFLSAINSTRSSAGLPPLKMDGGLQSHARKHSAEMSAAGEIYHSSNGELQAAAGGSWDRLGENVGRGGTVSSLHQAFLDSASHRANIHGDYNLVGIGTATADGVLYVTVVFMKKGGSAPETTTTTQTSSGSSGDSKSEDSKSDNSKPESSGDSESSDPTTTTTQPATTTTTIPPTTTTTLIVGPDRPVTPGESCYEATRYWWLCHD
ncbi:MAG TPA: CAP domain-containing protein [Acidimicrobiia bacterium]|nr:CAP domain-containing protein [Acidimicrobiia bacterium]